MIVSALWEGKPTDEVAHTATGRRLQPCEGGCARPRLVRRAAGAPDARGAGKKRWISPPLAGGGSRSGGTHPHRMPARAF